MMRSLFECTWKGLFLFIPLITQLLQAEGNSGVTRYNDIRPIVIKLATLAPSNSPWHEILNEMGNEWRAASNGLVVLRIYPGGVAGDEADMVRKIRIGQLQAAAITNNGLSRIVPEINVLTIPMLVDSWEGLDHLRQAIGPKLEALLAEKGFVVLNWGDAGWVRLFCQAEKPGIELVKKKSRLFVWSGDDRSIELWKSSGFHVIPLAATDILPALQTGMINAFNTTPIMALAGQWFAFTPYMIDLPWAPLVGATVINKRCWERIPEDLRAKLKVIAEKTGIRLREEIRRLEQEAIEVMQKRGLKVLKPNEQEKAGWRNAMQKIYPKIRGSLVPEAWFDEAIQVMSGQSLTDGH